MIEEEAIHDRTTTAEQPKRERINNGTKTPPKREQIAIWAVEALQSISQQTVQKAWCQTADVILLTSPCMKRISFKELK